MTSHVIDSRSDDMACEFDSNSEDAGFEAIDENVEYDVVITDEAFFALCEIQSDRVFEHVSNDLDLLRHSPFLGMLYDPAYEAKRPPFECRVLYCEHYGVYYRVDVKSHTLTLFAIVDQRRNPMARFEELEYSIENL